jgi:hypothetical protein
MICTRINDKNLTRYNYKFIPETDKVEVSNKDFYDVISYDDWCKEYYIVDKWRSVD